MNQAKELYPQSTLYPQFRHDLCIALDNNVVIECLSANAYSHDEEKQEQWVFIESSENHHGNFLTGNTNVKEITIIDIIG